jgi:hypothetical protein
MPEWLNGAACEAVKGLAFRGFESRFHRQFAAQFEKAPEDAFWNRLRSSPILSEIAPFFQMSSRPPTEKALKSAFIPPPSYRPRSD